MPTPRWSIGSQWCRWDPHLHSPGTLLNDQFGGDWGAYLRAIDDAAPPVRALGITDYFTMASYKAVLARRRAGALANVPLVFANIEVRLTIETRDHAGINLHLLVCPDDPDHVARVEEKLAHLVFPFRTDRIPCTDDGLVRLGRLHSGDAALPSAAAMSVGANQFKIDYTVLRDMFDKDRWLTENVLVAIAGGHDGLGGLSQDASFRAQREELGRFASIVFSGNPRDRAYWLGDHPDVGATDRVPKPCLHGCDAHELGRLLRPDEGRLCWIRAEPTFQGLHQTLLEPARRVFIGEEPPQTAHIGNVIRTVRIANAPWFVNGDLHLNDSLVCVIGAKGSGKTALAELIALAAGAGDDEPGGASFVAKAGALVDDVTVALHWNDRTSQQVTLGQSAEGVEPRVRYLSQQFVERLCAPHQLASPLVDEVERVVFSAIQDEDRYQCTAFGELRQFMLTEPIAERETEQAAISSYTQQITDETALHKSLGVLKARVAEAERARLAIEEELKTIPVKVSEENTRAQQACADKLKALQDQIAAELRRERDIRAVWAAVQRQLRSAEAAIRTLRETNAGLLEAGVWSLLTPRLAEHAESTLAALITAAQGRAESLRKHGTPTLPTGAAAQAATTLGLEALTAEHDRLTKALGLDAQKLKRRADLSKRLTVAKLGEDTARKHVLHAEKAPERRQKARDGRLASYERVFATLMAEEEALKQIYKPLSERIRSNERLSKLSFSVERVVDIARWVARGESLLDLRKPPFQGHGELEGAVRRTLLESWRAGSAQAAKSAMEAFLNEHARAIFESLATGVSPKDCGEWLFATDHIDIRYAIRYEGTELSQLSPGTKGVVLLMLYLGLDQWDHRPLVIDQPEENLDPRSVYSDLVPFFREAATRRQIIMVTHNANLVVNTDADQVIVAESQRHQANALPQMSYQAGGLEDPATRKQVCLLLEGGEDAFKRRELRYAIKTGAAAVAN